MSNAILVNNITPEQLTENILKEVRKEFQDLKKGWSPKEPDDYLTRMEVAKLLKISLVTVHKWSHDNILHPYKVGNRTYFSRKQIIKTMYSSNK